MIAIIDYGVGNLFSLKASLNYLGLENKVTNNIEEIKNADRIILPGVGAFEDAKRKLDESGTKDILLEMAAFRKPILGICLGMQMLFDKSFEFGVHDGLGLIKGEVCAIADDLTEQLKIPQMGWNKLQFPKKSELFKYINEGDYVYYVHSYYAKNCEESVIATSDYGVTITGAVQNKNVFGTQFHPEKSGKTGLNILKAFSEI